MEKYDKVFITILAVLGILSLVTAFLALFWKWMEFVVAGCISLFAICFILFCLGHILEDY